MSQIVGFYQTKSEAERVRDELISSGFGRTDVKLFCSTSSGTSATGTRNDDPGFWESLKEMFGMADEEDRQLYAEAARRGSCGVAVDADDDAEVRRATEILQRGKVMDLDTHATEWRKSGWQGGATTAGAGATTAATGMANRTTTTATTAAASTAGQSREAIPVVEEQLQVGKRVVQGGGVRIHSRVTERPVQEQVNLREEHVNVERRKVDRPLTDADKAAAFRERTIEATETVERPVVSKEVRVVEEVVVNKDVRQRTETVNDTVRRTDVEVDRTPGANVAASGAACNDPDRFASEIAADARYRNRDWMTVEPDARRTFEQRYPGSKWEQFKDAIHRGYEKVRQKV